MTTGKTFIIDCSWCKAKVAAHEQGSGKETGLFDEHEPYGTRISVGKCPTCGSLLVGESHQTKFEGYDSE